MKDNKPNIALIGCGKMGGSLLKGWLKADIASRVHVLEPHGLPEDFAEYVPNPVSVYRSAEEFIAAGPAADIFVLAVKPQVMDEVCQSVKAAVPQDSLILSIAAGRSIASFEKLFGASKPIVRVMPNLPASVGEGLAGLMANRNVSEEQRAQADLMLRAVGNVLWVDSEEKIHVVTAAAASGIAYFYAFAEEMARAVSDEYGFTPDEAMDMVRKTFEGAAALSRSEPGTPLSTLRANVTSKGGTTAAALDAMNRDNKLRDIARSAIEAAVNRSHELSL